MENMNGYNTSTPPKPVRGEGGASQSQANPNGTMGAANGKNVGKGC